MMPDWSEPFLAMLRETCDATAASKAAGIARSTAYAWKQSDEDFAAAWKDAVDEALDSLEGEGYRRAFKGCKKPVYQKGSRVGWMREYSDGLLMFFLKAKRRSEFGDHVRTEGEMKVSVELEKQIEEQVARIYPEEKAE